MSIEILEFTAMDYEAALALWRSSEGIGLSEADLRESIQRYLQRNPGMSFVARSDDKLVGAVLAGHDGRRGYLHHLAVVASARRQGIGSRLVEASLAALKEAGIRKCHLFLFNKNETGLSFWKSQGWEQRTDLSIASKEIAGGETESSC